MTKVKVAKSVAAHYAEFEENCVPKEAGKTQKRDMKAAFFAGATVVHCLMLDMAAQDQTTAMAALDVLHEEITSNAIKTMIEGAAL